MWLQIRSIKIEKAFHWVFACMNTYLFPDPFKYLPLVYQGTRSHFDKMFFDLDTTVAHGLWNKLDNVLHNSDNKPLQKCSRK